MKTNFLTYLATHQHAEKQVDGIMLLMAAITICKRVAVVHAAGIWRSYEDLTLPPDIVLIYLGSQKFRPTEVGTYFNIFSKLIQIHLCVL